MYKSDLKMHLSGNGSGYQGTHGEFVKRADFKFDADFPIAGTVQVHDKLPCVEQIWGASMQVVHQFHQAIGPLFLLFGTTQDNNSMSPLF